MKSMVYISAFFLITAVFCSCSDDIVTPPPDPCAGATRTSANFTMKEIILDSLKYETDTIYTGNTVEFSAKDSADEYLWTMSGTDQVWTTRTFQLKFYNFIGSIDIQLVVRRFTPNTKCFPDDKTTDTISKKLVVVHDSKIFGTFRGVSTINLLDTFVVTIKEYPNLPGDNRWVTIINLVNGCVDTTDWISGIYPVRIIGYRQYYFRSQHSLEDKCLYPDGLALLTADDSHLLVNYSLRDTTYPRSSFPIKFKSYIFKGVRI